MLFTISPRWVRSCDTRNTLIRTENETNKNGYAERHMNQSVLSFFLSQQFVWVPISMSNSFLCVHFSNDISVLDGGHMVVMQVQHSLVWSWATCSDTQLLTAIMVRFHQRLPSLDCSSSVFMVGVVLSIPLCCQNPHGLGVVSWKHTVDKFSGQFKLANWNKRIS